MSDANMRSGDESMKLDEGRITLSPSVTASPGRFVNKRLEAVRVEGKRTSGQFYSTVMKHIYGVIMNVCAQLLSFRGHP